MLRASEPRCPDSRGVDGVRWDYTQTPVGHQRRHIAVRESVVQTLGYDYPTKEQLDAVEQAIPATTRPVSCCDNSS